MTVHEVVFNGQQDGETHLNVVHFDLVLGVDADLQAFTDAIADKIIPAYTAALVASFVISNLTIREDIPGSVGTIYNFTAGPFIGTSTGANYAHQLAMLIRKSANSTQRPNNGRLFQGGMAVGGLDDEGQWLIPTRQAVRDFWDSLITFTFGTGGSAQMVIKASNPTAPNTVPYNPVAAISAVNVPSTQRRRRIGVGT